MLAESRWSRTASRSAPNCDGSIVTQVSGRAPQQAPAPQPEFATDDVHLLDYVKVVYKRWWTAATAFVVVFLGVGVYTFTATPIFEAKTRLLIESDEQNVVAFKQVVDEDQTKADYYQTQYSILQSRAPTRKTLEQSFWTAYALGFFTWPNT